MMAKEIKLLNDYFRGREGVRLTQTFRPKRGGSEGEYEGKIAITRDEEEFTFLVGVPSNFPLKGVNFFYEGDRVARHLLRAGYVCVESPFTASFAAKLAADLDALIEWIDRYVLHPEETHYEYLLTPPSPFVMLFDEEPEESPVREKRGLFVLKPLPGHVRLAGMVHTTFLAYGLGGVKNRWSKFYDQLPSAQIGKGIYFLLDAEPLNTHGQLISTLEELFILLDEEAANFIKGAIHDLEFQIALPGFIPVALGYPIPSQDGQSEIHWEWVLVKSKLAELLVPDQTGGDSLSWGKSINIAKSRFFGRGALSLELRNCKILLLGAGAIGSCLAESLVRGGIDQIELIDPDHVEAGNVCRSAYSISEIYLSKTMALLVSLVKISPYANITAGEFPFGANHRHTIAFQDLKTSLQSFDLIFDCTADDAVAYTLDQMKLRATIVNLTITDEARQLLAVTNGGGEAVLPQKNRILQSLQGDQPTANGPTFYEGTGCWHPTFRASFSDINLLLQHFLVGANRRLEQGHGWATTVLERLDGDYGIRVVQREGV